jgi:hypothetical protein
MIVKQSRISYDACKKRGKDKAMDIQPNPHLTVINGGANKKIRLTKKRPSNSLERIELTEEEILKEALKILESMPVRKRDITGTRSKRLSTVKTKILAGRMPTELINELRALGDSTTSHIERALRIYLKILKAGKASV